MDIGIGLPVVAAGVKGPELVEWAKRAEEAGFSTLSTIGRLVYDSHEELVALAAAAGATTRIGLMTGVLIGGARQPVLLAKQAATLAAISGGRFTLGLGAGARADDFHALGEQMTRRGARLEQLVATCRSVWAGEPPPGAERPVGPRPITVPIVIGAIAEPAVRRAGRIADGVLAPTTAPALMAGIFSLAKEAAAEAGRPAPRLHAARYVSFDGHAETDAFLADYYGFGGDGFVQRVIGSVVRSPGELRDAIAHAREAGADDLCLSPATAGARQIDEIAQVALH